MTLETAMLFAESLGTCTLMRTVKGGKAMRSAIIEGVLLTYPRLGECILMRAPTFDKKIEDKAIFTGGLAARLVNTSPLTEIIMMPDNEGLLCTTLSGSCYVLKAGHD